MSSHPDLPLHIPAEGVYAALHWDADGLIPVVAVQYDTGEALMPAYANRAALAKTLHSGWATYWSRSRGEIWTKGATSGNRQRVVAVRCDCDGDALLYLVDSIGPACHTGRRSCFSWLIASDGGVVCDRPLENPLDRNAGNATRSDK